MCPRCGEQFTAIISLYGHLIKSSTCSAWRTRGAEEQKTRCRALFSLGIVPKQVLNLATTTSKQSTQSYPNTQCCVHHNLPLKSVVSVAVTSPLGELLVQGTSFQPLSAADREASWQRIERHSACRFSRNRLLSAEPSSRVDLPSRQLRSQAGDPARLTRAMKMNSIPLQLTLHDIRASRKASMRAAHRLRAQLQLCRPCTVRVDYAPVHLLRAVMRRDIQLRFAHTDERPTKTDEQKGRLKAKSGSTSPISDILGMKTMRTGHPSAVGGATKQRTTAITTTGGLSDIRIVLSPVRQTQVKPNGSTVDINQRVRRKANVYYDDDIHAGACAHGKKTGDHQCK